MKTCPYLGKYDDSETPVLFPSILNGCFRGKELRIPDFEHQESYCLSVRCADCPAYSDPSQVKKISSLKQPDDHGFAARKRWGLLAIILLVVGLVSWALMGKFDTAFMMPATYIEPTRTETLAPTSVTPTSTIVELAPTNTVTATVITALPEVTLTPSLVPVILLETPIGNDPGFVIHQLEAGDNLSRLAEQYQTSVESIKLANYDLSLPLQEGKVIIIPVGNGDITTGILPFEAYQVDDEDVLLEELAETLGVDVSLFIFYNNLLAGQVLPKGTWLIIPRQR